MVYKRMDGEEFYRLFRKHFSPSGNEEVKKLYLTDIDVSGGEWTKLVEKVIFNVMSVAGFGPDSYSSEVGVIRGRSRGLVDHKWEKSNEMVYLEHENSMKPNIQTEVRNLLNSDGDLRILITYSSNANERAGLKENILNQLKRTKSSRKFEFLLIMGRDFNMRKYDDWEAYSFKPSYDVYSLGV